MIKSYSRIWALLTRRERWRFLGVVGLTLVMALFELGTVAGILPLLSILANPGLIETQPMLIGFAEVFGLEGFREVTLAIGGIVFAVVIIGMAVRAAVTFVQIRFALGRSYSLSTRLLHRYLSHDYVSYLGRNTATLSQSLLSEVDLVVRESVLPGVLLISNAAILILVGGFLFYVEPYVAVGALTLLIGIYLSAFFLLRGYISAAGRKRMAANKARFTVVQEVTGSLKDIKIAGLERTSLSRFRTPAREMTRHQTIGLVLQRVPRFALEAAVYGGFVATVLVLIVVRGNDLTDLLPILGLLAISATKLFPALQQIYQQISGMRMSQAPLERLYQDMQTTEVLPDLLERDGPILSLTKSITFRDVVYRYPEAQATALRGLSLEIAAQSTVGIVGGTGAGKTTVIDLLLGLLRPDEGAIEIDGTPLDTDQIRAWQRNIGYVPQTIFLSDDSVAANIAFGLPKKQIDMDRMITAAKLAKLHEFVTEEMPQGYDTPVGERGLRLSGGQRQRIGIARALYRDPEVLVLDEATSALDNITERAVMEAVRGLGGHKTIIMIAHRLSTVADCDTIFLFEHGQVSAQGRYDTLLAESETFRRMVNE